EELAQLTPETIRSYQHALVSRDRELPRTITAGDREIEFSQALRHPEYFEFVYNQVQESNDWQLLRKLDQVKVLENAHEALAAAEPESAPEPNPEADSEITFAAMPETTPRPGG